MDNLVNFVSNLFGNKKVNDDEKNKDKINNDDENDKENDEENDEENDVNDEENNLDDEENEENDEENDVENDLNDEENDVNDDVDNLNKPIIPNKPELSINVDNLNKPDISDKNILIKKKFINGINEKYNDFKKKVTRDIIDFADNENLTLKQLEILKPTIGDYYFDPKYIDRILYINPSVSIGKNDQTEFLPPFFNSPISINS